MPHKKQKTIQPITKLYPAFLLSRKIRELGISAFLAEWSAARYRFEHCLHKPKPSARKKTSSKRASGKNDRYHYIAYRFRGYPTSEQETFLKQNIGAARWMWNRLKADSEEHYRQMGFVMHNTPADYKDISEYSWLKDADSLALANVQLQYERAVSDWLDGSKGRPRFKKKHVCTDSYTTNRVNENLHLDGAFLTLPKLEGKLRLSLHQKLTPGGRLKSVTVVHEPDGKWYFSLLMEYPKQECRIPAWLSEFLETGDITPIRHIGLDMSLPYLYVDSEGCLPSYTVNEVEVSFVKAYRKLEHRIAREQRKLSQMQKNSNNYQRQLVKIARLHAKAKHRRSDFLHQMAVRLARSYDIISIEDLDIAAMKKALKFGKSVSDNGWGMFTRILEEKCLQYGTLLVRIDRWFPSSKKCSHCGHIHRDLKLNDRTYICPKCGHVMDRDKQAAHNIDEEGLRMVLDFLLECGQYRQSILVKESCPKAG